MYDLYEIDYHNYADLSIKNKAGLVKRGRFYSLLDRFPKKIEPSPFSLFVYFASNFFILDSKVFILSLSWWI